MGTQTRIKLGRRNLQNVFSEKKKQRHTPVKKQKGKTTMTQRVSDEEIRKRISDITATNGLRLMYAELIPLLEELLDAREKLRELHNDFEAQYKRECAKNVELEAENKRLRDAVQFAIDLTKAHESGCLDDVSTHDIMEDLFQKCDEALKGHGG